MSDGEDGKLQMWKRKESKRRKRESTCIHVRIMQSRRLDCSAHMCSISEIEDGENSWFGGGWALRFACFRRIVYAKPIFRGCYWLRVRGWYSETPLCGVLNVGGWRLRNNVYTFTFTGQDGGRCQSFQKMDCRLGNTYIVYPYRALP